MRGTGAETVMSGTMVWRTVVVVMMLVVMILILAVVMMMVVVVPERGSPWEVNREMGLTTIFEEIRFFFN
jgi:hypothetical protein